MVPSIRQYVNQCYTIHFIPEAITVKPALIKTPLHRLTGIPGILSMLLNFYIKTT